MKSKFENDWMYEQQKKQERKQSASFRKQRNSKRSNWQEKE